MQNIFDQFNEFLKGDTEMVFTAGTGHKVRGPEAKLFLFLFKEIEKLKKQVHELKNKPDENSVANLHL